MAKRREIRPCGPFEKPETCAHEWEPHLWERRREPCLAQALIRRIEEGEP